MAEEINEQVARLKTLSQVANQPERMSVGTK